MTDLPSTWINRTGLPVMFVSAKGDPVTTLEPSTAAAAVGQPVTRTAAVLVNGHEVPAVDSAEATVVDLPSPIDGIGVIVTQAVARLGLDRSDLWEPHDVIADHGNGSIVCRGLIRRRRGDTLA